MAGREGLTDPACCGTAGRTRCRSYIVSHMNPTAIKATEAMVAPVVLITPAAVLSTGYLAIFASVNDRKRA